MNEEMKKLGIDEDFLVDEELKQVQSEYDKLKELSMGKPSDEGSLDLDYDKGSVKSNVASDLFQFTAIKKAKNKKRNKRIDRLQKAYGKKNKSNLDLLSSYKKSPSKKDRMADLFPELAIQESQIINTDRK